MARADSRLPSSVGLDCADRTVALRVRQSPRARRIHLRIDAAAGDAELVVPRGVGLAQALDFAHRQSGWLSQRLEALPPRIAFAEGSVIPVLGEMLVIRHRPDHRGGVRREGAELLVAGRPEHLARRVRDWLKALARRELGGRARALAHRVDRPLRSLRIGDARTRWGSCSAQRGLAFSWRLMLAPPAVVDYIVAHEVAHLVELNHGPRFWRLVEELAGDTRSARNWLARHGAALLRYG